jgi:glycosyltransferase involved in cell wall biosynthesis
VVVNYNYARFLDHAVRSVLDQSMPFDQVIVVDDGSTDDSADVLRKYEGDLQLITKANGGPLSAAWAAVAATDCDYFYLLDADDSAAPDLVEVVRPLLADDPLKVQFQLRSMNVDGDAIDSVFPSYREGYSSERMRDDNERLGFYVCAPTSGNVFKTDYLRFLTTMGLDEREAYDGVPAQLAPYFGEIVSMNRPLAHYRVHETSLSAWSAPTPALMKRELERYENRWEQVLRVLANEGIEGPDPARSAFVTERELMSETLEGRRPRLSVSALYATTILRSGRSLPQRIAFAMWGVAMAVLPRGMAVDLVKSKRAVGKRGRITSLIARAARAREPKKA